MIGITNLGDAARCIDNNYSVLRTLNKKNNLNEILKIYNDINEKIKEFNTYKNINSMNGFCKRQCCEIQTIKDCANLNRLPVTFIAEGEIKNPIDAALMMRIGFDSVIVENSIFDNNNPSDKDNCVPEPSPTCSGIFRVIFISHGWNL